MSEGYDFSEFKHSVLGSTQYPVLDSHPLVLHLTVCSLCAMCVSVLSHPLFMAGRNADPHRIKRVCYPVLPDGGHFLEFLLIAVTVKVLHYIQLLSLNVHTSQKFADMKV